LPANRPVLLVANHFNGFVDPIVIATAVGRLPRFIAKASLKRVTGLGLLLRAVGVVFVARSQDGDGTGANRSAFAECHAALLKHDVVAIFPEGTTHDRPHLDPVRTGAARIALGARAAGAQGFVIVPVGLTYPDKLALRSSVFVEFGEPLELDQFVTGDASEDDHGAVDALTAEIDGRLRSVSPDFPDVESWLVYDLAAEIATRSAATPDPALADRARAARAITAAPQAEQESVRAAVGRYAALLNPLRLTDSDVAAGPNTASVLWAAIVAGAWVAVLGALVLATIIVNIVPFLLVFVASLRTHTPVTKGTVRILVGLVAFPIAWLIGAIEAVDGAGPIIVAFFVFAAGAPAVIALVDRAMVLARRATAWHQVRERTAAIVHLHRIRDDATEIINRVIAHPPAGEQESLPIEVA
jgi:1-acyl-sn-glycerol-3-phosphate acyltransferase